MPLERIQQPAHLQMQRRRRLARLDEFDRMPRRQLVQIRRNDQRRRPGRRRRRSQSMEVVVHVRPVPAFPVPCVLVGEPGGAVEVKIDDLVEEGGEAVSVQVKVQRLIQARIRHYRRVGQFS